MTTVRLLFLALHLSQYYRHVFSDCFRSSIEAFTNGPQSIWSRYSPIISCRPQFGVLKRSRQVVSLTTPSFGIRQRPTLPGALPWLLCDPGSSHGRVILTLPAIPDAPPAFNRHRRRQTPVPQDAAMASPNQVRCMHVGWDNQAEASCR